MFRTNILIEMQTMRNNPDYSPTLTLLGVSLFAGLLMTVGAALGDYLGHFSAF